MDEREERAFEALIVMAFQGDEITDEDCRFLDLSTPGPALSPEDKAALESLGPDFISRLIDEEVRDRLGHQSSHPY